ncbi:uncharacterized protein LOC134258969 [Saccostrea cucullata]|uniref:uncharacterized protein LOC134258969 n=1 Tax=Saccostrea cuccullata TaxID=36930 RepID=UPI002ECFF6D9
MSKRRHHRMADIARLINLVQNLAEKSTTGKFDRGGGRIVTWSIEGHFTGHWFQWKCTGTCKDLTTGETGYAETENRDEAIEDSLKDMFQKLHARDAIADINPFELRQSHV